MNYSIQRSQRKTLSVSVRDGKVVVHALIGLPNQKIEEFVYKHRLWIARRLQEQSERPTLDFTDGSTLILFGRERRIQTGRTSISSDTICLPQENREQALIRLLKAYTRENMTAITEELASRYGFHYAKIKITSARTRWGSCNAEGTIAYTFRAAFLPVNVAFYLAAHELCHTRHMDHSRAFWELVKKIVPDCMERRRELKRYNWVMKYL